MEHDVPDELASGALNMRIRVCDDVEAIAEEWVAAIKAVVPAEFDVARMEAAKDGVSHLLGRKRAIEEDGEPFTQANQFDEVDVLVVDYDLLHLDDAGGRTTGEGVARLARSFSTCGAIVVMNQFKGPQFDLGMRGHLDSFAETNIDASLVGQRALWQVTEPAEGRLNPTVWTPMPDLLAAARGLAARFGEQGLESLIMPALGLQAEALAELSDTAFGFVSSKAQTAEELGAVTLRQFLEGALEADVVACLSAKAPDVLFRFGAFRLVKWLDRAVLRPMDVFVDAAHLLDRLPFMIDAEKADPTDAGTWAKAVYAPRDVLRWDVLQPYCNEVLSAALGRSAFDWFRISKDERIDALQDEYLKASADRFYLAEDTSRFVEKEALTRFRADFHNFGDRRGVENLQGISYGPLRRVRFG